MIKADGFRSPPEIASRVPLLACPAVNAASIWVINRSPSKFGFWPGCGKLQISLRADPLMNDQRRQEIGQRWQEIERELAEIADCKTTLPCDPPQREAELLIEQDA